MDIKKVEDILELIEELSPETLNHMERTAMYALSLARRLEFSSKDRELTYFAGFLHDIGKVRTPSEILNNPNQGISVKELNQTRENIYYGSNLVMMKEGFEEVAKLISTHQEKYDGTGLKGLKGEEIPLISRISHLADAYDAMRYVKGMKHQDAIVEMREKAGTQFDPELVEPFIRAVVKEKLLKLQEEMV